jgi:protoporphyrinogen oxidase
MRDSALIAAALALPRCATFSSQNKMTAVAAMQFDQMNPIERTLSSGVEVKDFFGDKPAFAHKILWDKAAFLAEKKVSRREKTKVVVVGGGVSGLTTAYYLRKQNPILLEQCARLGGNAKGQSWQGIDYNIGSAYMATPEKGSKLSILMSDLELTDVMKLREAGSPIALGNEIHANYWKHPIATDDHAQAQKIKHYCLNVLNEAEGLIYPDIPIRGESEEKDRHTVSLDNESFRGHIENVVGTKLHSQISDVLEQYCWSSFAATASEVSAAAGLNFFASEFGPITVMPGGNATFTEAISKKMFTEMPAQTLRPQSLVVNIQVKEGGVEVLYVDQSGALVAIDADRVVFAAPKFVAKHVITNLSEAKYTAMSRLTYRSYLVANVLVNKAIPKKYYDVFLLKKENVGSTTDQKNLRASVKNRGATDLVFANYAAKEDASKSVLTLFKAIPYDGGRAELYADGVYAQVRKEFEEQVKNEIAPTVGFSMNDVADIRITRHGHPLPVAGRGLIHEGICKAAHAPIDNRIFFVNQDNWALPSFETGYLEAEYWSEKINGFYG